MNVLDQQQLEFSRILEISDLMLVDAQNERWESVVELQFLRDGLLHAFFEYKVEIDGEGVSSGIKHMIDTDQKLTRLAEKEKYLLQGQINKMKQGKDAIKAYGI